MALESIMSTKHRGMYSLLSAIVLVLYLILGGLIFVAVERPHWEQNPTIRIRKLEEASANLERLKSYLENSSYVLLANGSELEVLEETSGIVDDLLDLEIHDRIPWNLNTGVHFCMTAVTTIGYGYIVPETQLGRGICILYIILGIPLNLFLSANIGHLLAEVIFSIWEKICRRSTRLFPWCLYRKRGDVGESSGTSSETVPKATNIPEYYNNCAYSRDDMAPTPKTITRFGFDSSQPSQANSVPARSNLVKTDASNGPPREEPPENGESKGGIRSGNEKSKDTFNVCPMSFVCALVASFTTGIAMIVYAERGPEWTFVDSLYFTVVTFTTVGFGDLGEEVTKDLSSENFDLWKKIYTYAIMELGLIVMATALTVWSENLKRTATRAKKSLMRHIDFPEKCRDQR